MKKIILSFVVIAALVFTSCSSDDDNGDSATSCATLIAAAESASDAYFEDFESVEKCNAFKSALQAALDGGCGTAEERADAEESLEFLTCE